MFRKIFNMIEWFFVENEYEPRERSKTNSLSESDQNAEYPFVRKRYVPIVQYYDYEEGADGQDVKFPIMEQINFETKGFKKLSIELTQQTRYVNAP